MAGRHPPGFSGCRWHESLLSQRVMLQHPAVCTLARRQLESCAAGISCRTVNGATKCTSDISQEVPPAAPTVAPPPGTDLTFIPVDLDWRVCSHAYGVCASHNPYSMQARYPSNMQMMPFAMQAQAGQCQHLLQLLRKPSLLAIWHALCQRTSTAYQCPEAVLSEEHTQCVLGDRQLHLHAIAACSIPILGWFHGFHCSCHPAVCGKQSCSLGKPFRTTAHFDMSRSTQLLQSYNIERCCHMNFAIGSSNIIRSQSVCKQASVMLLKEQPRRTLSSSWAFRSLRASLHCKNNVCLPAAWPLLKHVRIDCESSIGLKQNMQGTSALLHVQCTTAVHMTHIHKPAQIAAVRMCHSP